MKSPYDPDFLSALEKVCEPGGPVDMLTIGTARRNGLDEEDLWHEAIEICRAADNPSYEKLLKERARLGRLFRNKHSAWK